MPRIVLGLVAMVLALAGCGATGSEPATTPGSATASDSTRTPRPSAAPSPRDKLADLAEQQASASPTSAPTAPPTFADPVLGADMGWPQCPVGLGIPERRTQGNPLPLAAARYVVVGLTNGPGFTPNPCLADQVSWVRSAGLMGAAYAVASFPDDATLARYGGDGPFNASTRLGALSNTGYQQARFNVTSMLQTGLETPIVWIDVEPVPDFDWSADTEANAAVVRGVARGYLDAGYRIGVYSTPYLWSLVVGDLRLGVPEWRAAGQTSRAAAILQCGPDQGIQGGRAVLGQWVEQERDQNITCPGIAAEMGRWFHQY